MSYIDKITFIIYIWYFFPYQIYLIDEFIFLACLTCYISKISNYTVVDFYLFFK